MYLIHFPYSAKIKKFRDLNTTSRLDLQIWQELVALRFLPSSKYLKAPKKIAPWIDQARFYYIDAVDSDWRSGGLLYYYSFLNLAKAFLVANSAFTYKSLDSTLVYHGLTADQQTIDNISNYQISIYPPKGRNNSYNVFAYLYQAITGISWPFRSAIKLKLNSILGYCPEIAGEIQLLYNLEPSVDRVQSFIRNIGNDYWYEIITTINKSDLILNSTSSWTLNKVVWNQLSLPDKNDCSSAFNLKPQALMSRDILRSEIIHGGESNYAVLARKANSVLSSYSIPFVGPGEPSPFWWFCPELNVNNMKINWHPLLSDYLIAFSLSSILRYQPQLIKSDSKNAFFVEAWCRQSTITALRYFLMYFTRPATRILAQ